MEQLWERERENEIRNYNIQSGNPIQSSIQSYPIRSSSISIRTRIMTILHKPIWCALLSQCSSANSSKWILCIFFFSLVMIDLITLWAHIFALAFRHTDTHARTHSYTNTHTHHFSLYSGYKYAQWVNTVLSYLIVIYWPSIDTYAKRFDWAFRFHSFVGLEEVFMHLIESHSILITSVELLPLFSHFHYLKLYQVVNELLGE